MEIERQTFERNKVFHRDRAGHYMLVVGTRVKGIFQTEVLARNFAKKLKLAVPFMIKEIPE